MKKTVAVITLITTLLITALAGAMLVSFVAADPFLPEYLPKITIKSDGSITPETEYINRTGNLYTLTADILDEYLAIKAHPIGEESALRTLVAMY